MGRGSHLKEYTYKVTGGTDKYEGASGGGTYVYDNLTDTLAGHLQRYDNFALSAGCDKGRRSADALLSALEQLGVFQPRPRVRSRR
jgi:hypothetical protein